MSTSDEKISRRKYPRLPWKQKGELSFKDDLGDPVLVPVVIRSISPEGLGLGARRDDELPPVGTRVHVTFQIGQRDIELPGRVVWRQRASTHSALGIRLTLALAKAAMRHAYASWIVDRLRRSRQGQERSRVITSPQPA